MAGAVAIAALLTLSVFTMLPKAEAQVGTTLYLSQRIQVVYTDNSTTNLEELSQFSPADLTKSGKTVAYLDFRTIVITNPSKAMFIQSVSGASYGISVLTPGGYADISTAGADKTPQKLFGIDDTQWQIFYLRVPASSFDAAIGTRTADMASQIRFSETGTVKVTARIANISDQYNAFPVTAVYPMTAKSTGGVDPDPCTTNCSEDDPSGNISYRVSIQRASDGLWISYIGLTQLQTFNLFVTGDCGVNPNCADFKAIKYEKWVHMDNDVWNMPNKIVYDNPGASGNYGVYINGQVVPFAVVDTLQSKGRDNYIVLEMTAQEADIIPKLTDLGPIGTSGDHQYSGTIDFIHSHAVMPVVSPAQTFNINIPSQTVTINVGGISNPNNPDPCEFSAEVTDCDPDPDPDPTGFPQLEMWQILGLAAGASGIIGGIVYVAKKK